jgi:hypothetical protein
MLTGSAVPRLTHILKSIPKDEASTSWMQSADDVHLSTWLDCAGAEQLHDALITAEKDHLAASLDLPPQFGGVGLQSLMRVVNKELLGSWASITADLITFCKSKGLLSYSMIADALDSMADPPPPHEEHQIACIHPAIAAMKTFSVRAHTFPETISNDEINFTTSLIMGERTLEIPGRYMPLETPARPDTIGLSDLRTTADYATTPCKHECAILKQYRHVRQAHAVWRDDTIMQRALMLSRAGQCGLDTAKAFLPDVIDVATMDRPTGYEHLDLCESTLYSASTLNLHGLPYDFASLAPVLESSLLLSDL